ncbi:hypothetical protein [Sorangium sp. So ce176]|uniref:hypothetical protein n=1 Tax=Sorangium sp. So ce176 TaxID=3133286 RepID=UPI003F639747
MFIASAIAAESTPRFRARRVDVLGFGTGISQRRASKGLAAQIAVRRAPTSHSASPPGHGYVIFQRTASNRR